MNYRNKVLWFAERRRLLVLLAASIIAAGLVGASLGWVTRASAQPTPFPLSPTPVSTPAPPSPSGALPGVYSFRSLGEETPDYSVELRADGRTFVQERPVGAIAIGASAAGTWSDQQGDALITLTSLAGEAVVPVETMRLRFEDGFPVGAEAKAGGRFERLPQASFTLGVGEQHPLVSILHQRLAAVAWLNFSDPGSDIYGQATRQAVAGFQEGQGLAPSGVLDAGTWLRLGAPLPPQPAPPLPGEANAGDLPAHTGEGKPILYLTFDDGPMPQNTTVVLDLLDKYHAKATFFVVGAMVTAFPDTLRDVIARGHAVGNHTWNHKSLKGLSRKRFASQVERTDEAITAALGDTATREINLRYLRPPYGATDRNTKQFAAGQGYTIMMWNVDPQDWRRRDAKAITRNVLRHVRPGAVILLHDGGGNRSQTLASLRALLPELKAQGYVFRSLPAPR